MIYMVIKGGLGNQLAQAMMGVILENITGEKARFIISYYRDDPYNRTYLLEEYFPALRGRALPIDVDLSGIPIATEPYSNINPTSIMKELVSIIQNKRNIILDGYWWMGDYFSNYAKIYKEALKVDVDESDAALGEIIQQSEMIGIHVRRSEYGHHGIAKMDYYRNAIWQIRQERGQLPALVFSDEYNVCKYEFSMVENLEVIKGDTRNPIRDFYMLSQCRHFVLANSSFSAWAARIGETENSIVYFPYPFSYVVPDAVIDSSARINWRVVDNAVVRA